MPLAGPWRPRKEILYRVFISLLATGKAPDVAAAIGEHGEGHRGSGLGSGAGLHSFEEKIRRLGGIPRIGPRW